MKSGWYKSTDSHKACFLLTTDCMFTEINVNFLEGRLDVGVLLTGSGTIVRGRWGSKSNEWRLIHGLSLSWWYRCMGSSDGTRVIIKWLA